jgi:hypothetical protein
MTIVKLRKLTVKLKGASINLSFQARQGANENYDAAYTLICKENVVSVKT